MSRLDESAFPKKDLGEKIEILETVRVRKSGLAYHPSRDSPGGFPGRAPSSQQGAAGGGGERDARTANNRAKEGGIPCSIGKGAASVVPAEKRKRARGGGMRER